MTGSLGARPVQSREMAAGKAGQSVGEKAALSRWESKLTNCQTSPVVTAAQFLAGRGLRPE